jgi:hypothetical protein
MEVENSSMAAGYRNRIKIALILIADFVTRVLGATLFANYLVKKRFF